nr:hypothetical protein GCM10025732_58810 [Glycomyces mayteni]
MVDQGVVCSVDPHVSRIGADVLANGGNAVDAAIAAGAALTIVAPHLCGLGGDLFALVHVPGESAPAYLNASGRAGSGADAEVLRAEGHRAMPFRGDLRSATVPGCVDGWFALHERYGSRPMAELLAPAIELASKGWPATAMLAKAGKILEGVAGAGDLVGLEAGATVTRERTAAALRAAAEGGRDGFYLGDFGQGLVEIGKGLFTEADLAAVQAQWEEPISVEAFGHRIWAAAPNSQGYLLLLALAIADKLDLPVDAGDPLWAHYLVEAARQAGYDRPERLFDGADVADLLAAAGSGPGGSARTRRPTCRCTRPRAAPRTWQCSTGTAWASPTSSRTRPGSGRGCSSRAPASASRTAGPGSTWSRGTRPSTGRGSARRTRSCRRS